MKTEETITFEDFDCFELKKFCNRLEAFANVEHDYVEGSLVLALNAGFGSGKTTFIEMWQNSLLSRREKGEFVPMPVVLNAWESDHCGEPLLAVLAGLVEAVENWRGTDTPNKSKFKKAAKEVGWFATGLANEFVAKWTGLNSVKAEEYVTKKTGIPKVPTPDFIEMYQQRIGALKGLKSELRTAFGGPNPKVLVFVDELDRCRPDYAVSYLETIKHVFDIDGMAFVLAVDYEQLKGSTLALYGSHLMFDEYFRKFCHRTFELPSMNQDSYRRIAGKYVHRYLASEGKRITMFDLSSQIEQRVIEVVQALRMRPRQIQEAFRIMGHTMQTLDESKSGKILWGYATGCILLSCFRVGRPETFHRYRKEKGGVRDLCLEILALMGIKDAQWWIQVALAGSRSYETPKEFFADLLVELGYSNGNPESVERFLSGYSEAFNRNENQLHRIANMIEEAQTF